MTGAGLPPVDLALVALYAGLLLYLAYRRGREDRGEVGDYLLAGRALTVPAFVATLVSTWYGGVLGVGEYSYLHGLSNWIALGGPYYATGLIFAFLLAHRARASDLVTVPERLRRDHGRAAGTMGAALVFVTMLPAPYLLMLGVLTERSLGVDLVTGTVIAGVFSALCVIGGGFRSVVRTNVLQFVLMYGGFLLILPIALSRIGGFKALGQLPAGHLTWDGGLGFQAIAVWYVIAAQALVEPTFYQRCYAAKSPSVARRGILWSVVFWVVFDALTTTTGMAARVLLPNLDNAVEAYPALADAVLPPVLRGLFYVGLIATVMSTVESYLFVAATTLGYDVPMTWRREISEEHSRRWTRVGLVVATAASVALALAAGSVIALWKGIGSVITPALLLPLVGGFVPALRAGRHATLASMTGSAAIALGWMAPSWFGGTPLLGWEPIFPALAWSVACHLPAWLRPGGRRAG